VGPPDGGEQKKIWVLQNDNNNNNNINNTINDDDEGPEVGSPDGGEQHGEPELHAAVEVVAQQGMHTLHTHTEEDHEKGQRIVASFL
jgi:hypothetical protein